MKKFTFLLALFTCLFAFNVNAITLEEKIAKVDASYQKRITQINNMKRASAEKKEILKKHAKQNRDLKVEQTKELDSLMKASKK